MNNLVELNTQNLSIYQLESEDINTLIKFFEILIQIDHKLKKEVIKVELK